MSRRSRTALAACHQLLAAWRESERRLRDTGDQAELDGDVVGALNAWLIADLYAGRARELQNALNARKVA